MDLEKSAALRKEYTELSDEQLIELALQGKGDFVEGAYNLIMDEVSRRDLEEKVDAARNAAGEEPGQCGPSCTACANEGAVNEATAEELMPVVIILKEDDLADITSALDNAAITYCNDPLQIKGKEYPRLIMVPKNEIDRTIELFGSFIPKSSVLLWR